MTTRVRPTAHFTRFRRRNLLKRESTFVHYVPVQRDWSDLEARLAWAEAHPAAAANISANARAHVLKTLGASAASERRVVMAVLRGYRQALACAQSA